MERREEVWAEESCALWRSIAAMIEFITPLGRSLKDIHGTLAAPQRLSGLTLVQSGRLAQATFNFAVYTNHNFRKLVGVNPVRRRNADEKWLLLENPNRKVICSIGNSGWSTNSSRAFCSRLSMT